MGIFRGTGGSGQATTDVYASKINGYATTATTKASEAAASATEAANTLDSFDDRYLGAKASDPTADNDGDALIAGALYFNTAIEGLKVYTGSTWNTVATGGDGAYLTVGDANILYEPKLTNSTRMKFFRKSTAPEASVENLQEGDMWYETDTENVYFWRETGGNVYSWTLLSTGTSDSDTLDGGSY